MVEAGQQLGGAVRVAPAPGPGCPRSIRWTSRPHGRVVGPPYSSLLNQLPTRPIACASGRPGASASANTVSGMPSWRQPSQAPTAPPATAPQMPRPPSQILNAASGSPPAPKYVLRRGDHVVDPGADDAERHRPDGDVEHGVLRRAAAAQAHLGDDAGDDDAEHDAQGVRPDRERAEVPDGGAGAGNGGDGHGCTRYRSRTARATCPAAQPAGRPIDRRRIPSTQHLSPHQAVHAPSTGWHAR